MGVRVARTNRFPVGLSEATGHTVPLPEIEGKGIRLHALAVILASGISTYDNDTWLIEFGLTHNLQATERASRDVQSYGNHYSTLILDSTPTSVRGDLSFVEPLWGVEVGGSQRFLIFQTGDDNSQWTVRLYYELFTMPPLEWRALHQSTVIVRGGQ